MKAKLTVAVMLAISVVTQSHAMSYLDQAKGYLNQSIQWFKAAEDIIMRYPKVSAAVILYPVVYYSISKIYNNGANDQSQQLYFNNFLMRKAEQIKLCDNAGFNTLTLDECSIAIEVYENSVKRLNSYGYFFGLGIKPEYQRFDGCKHKQKLEVALRNILESANTKKEKINQIEALTSMLKAIKAQKIGKEKKRLAIYNNANASVGIR